MTENSREAIAVPAIAERVTNRMKDAVFLTASGANGGKGYASDILSVSLNYSKLAR
jgi:hypothetical protein